MNLLPSPKSADYYSRSRGNSTRRGLRIIAWGFLLALTVWLSACSVPLQLKRAPSRPTRFKAFFSNRFGTIQSVELRGDKVISVVQGASLRNSLYGPIQREIRIEPSTAEWRTFSDALDRANIWAWQSTYRNADFTGGPAWSYEIVYRKRRIVTAGYATYPSDQTPLEPADTESQRYKTVERAVERLIGRRLFN